MTIEQLQEENAKLKQALIDILNNCEGIIHFGNDGYYAVEKDIVGSACSLAFN